MYETPLSHRVRTYTVALGRQWVTLLTSGSLAAAVTVAINALGVQIPRGLYALVFLWFGGMAAGFRAWDEERAKRVQLEGAARPELVGPRLRLGFDCSDPLCVSMDSGDETFLVQVWNDGDRRAENVRVVLDELEPPANKLLGQPFPEAKGAQESFSVSPSQNRPPVYVKVLMQRQHAAYGHTQILRLKGADWLPHDTKRLRLVLRLEADVKAELFTLEFSADERNRMHVLPHA